MADNPDPSSLLPDVFSPATRDWFLRAFKQPTAVQPQTWHVAARSEHALVIAPTGSGKTLAAFLYALDQLFREGGEDTREAHKRKTSRILYISPIKALGTDVQRNLQLPLKGIADERRRRGETEVNLRVGIRTGDTPAQERSKLTRNPPDILITTPESLYLMLTSRARETLRGVETVIIARCAAPHLSTANWPFCHCTLSQRCGSISWWRSPGYGSQPAHNAPSADTDCRTGRQYG